jgi:translation initiation factor IF-2
VLVQVKSDEEAEEVISAEKERNVQRRLEDAKKLANYDKFIEFDKEEDIQKAKEGQKLQEQLNNMDAFVEDNINSEFSEILEADRLKRRPTNRARSYFKMEKRKNSEQQNTAEKIIREVKIGDAISVASLADSMSVKVNEVIKALLALGIHGTTESVIDGDTAELVVTELKHIPVRVQNNKETAMLAEQAIHKDMRPIAPVVTIMGHVDHGKTSLLDALRETDVASGEAGGITQHIGAYQTRLKNGKIITFIDTPGHAAFTAIRARGAKVTDIVVLVVAADDSIMPQTIEAINHAQSAGVPIIVAINKIDKPGANPEAVKNDLLQHNVITEEFGGEVIAVPISAKNRQNLDKLQEAILLQADVLDLKANFAGRSTGTVLEAKIDKNKGIIATVLVQKGILKPREIIIAGEALGRTRILMNERGDTLEEGFPSMPVEIYGFDTLPNAGDKFHIVENEKAARIIVEQRKASRIQMESAQKPDAKKDFFAKLKETKELKVIIKCDVQSSVEAIKGTLEKLKQDEVKLKILHCAAGNLSESDILLAKTNKATVFTFSVKLDSKILNLADAERVIVRSYNIIYELIDDVEKILKGMLEPQFEEKNIGEVEIKKLFDITGVGKIAGCLVLKGHVNSKALVKIMRDGKVLHETKIRTLKRAKDNVKEVSQNVECGIQLENFEDFIEGDKLEVFERVEKVVV